MPRVLAPLSVVMLSVSMLSVIMLSVVAPLKSVSLPKKRPNFSRENKLERFPPGKH
jgi:hypothetical protein